MSSLLKKGFAKLAAAAAAVGLFATDAAADVSMANVTAETTTVKTWMVLAGAIAIAGAIIGALIVAYGRSPMLGVGLVILAVVCGTLFVAALA